MASFGSGSGRVLYLIACAAPPVRRIGDVVASAQAAGWDVCVVVTPSALAWVDAAGLAAQTGHRVRSAFRGPDEAAFEPLGDAVLVAPATFNTVNKVALGINDNLALGLANEAVGAGIPTAVVAWAGGTLAGHPAFPRSLEVWRTAGTTVVAPDAGDDGAFLHAAEAALAALGPPG